MGSRAGTAPCQGDNLADTLKGLRGVANLRGFLLTTPHKTAGLDLVDWVGPEARLVGSVNAVRCGADGHWHGENLDGYGCLQGLLAAGHEVERKRVLVVGMGGAGRAVASAIARAKPATLCLSDTNQERVSQAYADLAATFAEVRITVGPPDPAGSDIVINCTPLGMAGSPGTSVDPARLSGGMLVVDLVIEPEMTELLKAAGERSCLVLPGRCTLEGQVDALCAFFDGGALG